jgi:hypothetical protein
MDQDIPYDFALANPKVSRSIVYIDLIAKICRIILGLQHGIREHPTESKNYFDLDY